MTLTGTLKCYTAPYFTGESYWYPKILLFTGIVKMLHSSLLYILLSTGTLICYIPSYFTDDFLLVP